LFFDTNEAIMLLKTKEECFENAQNKLVFRPKLAPKCAPKSSFLPISHRICASRRPNYKGLHGVPNLFQQAKIHGACQEKSKGLAKREGSPPCASADGHPETMKTAAVRVVGPRRRLGLGGDAPNRVGDARHRPYEVLGGIFRAEKGKKIVF